MSYFLTIHQPVVSANKLLRKHWAGYSDILGAWKHDVFYLCKEQKIPKMARVRVSAVIYFPDRRRRDQDNFEFGLRKMLGDSLKGVVIFDDDPSYLTWGEIAFEIDRHDPRTEVTLEEL